MADAPEIGELISAENAEDISADWIRGEIKLFENSAKEALLSSKTRPRKSKSPEKELTM